MTPTVQIAALGMAAGSAVGQLLNLVANGTGQESRGRLRLGSCSRCTAPASLGDFVPVLRWLRPGARCASCRHPRSYREPLLALVLGVAFAAAVERFGVGAELWHALLGLTLIWSVGVVSAVFWIMPFVLTLPGVALGILASPLSSHLSWGQALLGALLGFGFVLALEILSARTWGGEPLGGGVKFFVALIGSFLGVRGVLILIPLAIAHAFVLAAVMMLFRDRASIPTEREQAPAEDNEEIPDSRWRPSRWMIQAGPVITLVAVELMVAGGSLPGLHLAGG